MLSLSDFLSGVGQLKFRGTSVLFRLPQTLIDNYKHSWKYNLKRLTPNKKSELFATTELTNNINITSHSCKFN